RSGPESCDRRRRQLLHRSWGDDLLERGDRVGARRQLVRALKFEPFDRWALRLYFSTFASERWRARARTLLRARRESRPKSAAPSSSEPGTERRTLRGFVARRENRQ